MGDDHLAVRSANRVILLACAIAIGLSFVLSVGDDGAVRLPSFSGKVARDGLPPLCPSAAIFSVKCPGCGMTRAFVQMSRLRVGAAWAFNPAGPLLYLFVLGQIPFRLHLLRRRPRAAWTRSRWLTAPLYAIVALAILGWIVDVFSGG